MNSQNSQHDRNPLLEPLMPLPECKRRVADTDWFPAVDVTEVGQTYLLEVDLPGLKPEEVQVNVDEDILSITGKRLSLHSGGKRLRVERPAGAFVCRLVLPPQSRRNSIQARLLDGVLQVHVPKQAPEVESEKPFIVHSEEPHYEHSPS